MELTHLNQLDFEEIRLEKIDCLFATAGTQLRCLFLPEALKNIASRKIVLVGGGEDSRSNRFLKRFDEWGFVQQKIEFNDPASVDMLLSSTCNKNARHINILIDYTCMPKKWYALFIDSITRNTYPAERINLFLSLTPRIFERNPGKSAIDYFGPIIFDRDKLKEKKPVSLIVSLDHNSNSLNEAVSKVKPQKILAFIPHCTHDPEYSRLVRENNSLLLERLDTKNIIGYEADQPEEINTLLTSRCLDERIHSEVVIVPQGPKTFSMMSMLLSVRYPDIKLWEIVLKDRKISSDQGNPAANPVIVKVSFINDELD